MTNYIKNQQNIMLPAKNGGTIILSLTKNSGRIVYRDKINTLIGIKHPGIELGTDQFGYRWFVHHHYRNRRPSIEREDAFSLGVPIFYDNRKVDYSQDEILERALKAWWSGQEYHWLWKNCQHFVNGIARNKHYSDSVEKIADTVMAVGCVTGLLGLLTSNKALIKIGFGMTAGGAIGKGLSQF